MSRKLTAGEREAQATQFEILADAIERQHDPSDRYSKATIHVILRSVSRSGMSRVIDLVVVDQDGDIRDLMLVGQDFHRYDYSRNGYVVQGCGMDMGFHLVDTVCHALRNWCADNGRPELAERLGDWHSIIRHSWL